MAEKRGSDYVRAAIAHYRSGRDHDALRTFMIARQKGASDPLTASYIGMLVAKVEGRREEGLQMCQRALQIGIVHAELYYNLALTQVLCGKRGKAVETLRRGLRVSKGNKEMLELINELRPRGNGVVPGIGREHPVNNWLGKARRKS